MPTGKSNQLNLRQPCSKPEPWVFRATCGNWVVVKHQLYRSALDLAEVDFRRRYGASPRGLTLILNPTESKQALLAARECSKQRTREDAEAAKVKKNAKRRAKRREQKERATNA